MKRVLLIAALAAALAGCAQKPAPLKTCIFPGDYPDPTILRDGNDFYMTHSSFTYFPALLVWHSTDLVNWEPVARAVEDGDYSIFVFIDVTLLGNVILVRLLQSQKAQSSILVTPSGRFISVRLWHLKNASIPIDLTLFGIFTLVSFKHS